METLEAPTPAPNGANEEGTTSAKEEMTNKKLSNMGEKIWSLFTFDKQIKR